MTAASPPLVSRVVATAGHVDHGKSTLVLALTGTDPDRFAEEKRRGLTIDLGFAHTTLPSGAGLSLVDVPGHVRFLKNMLAGVGAVDGCLFVVAATEGWKPQSEEHLRIVELLGIDHGVVALTKVDATSTQQRRAVHAAVAERLRGTSLAGAEIVAVSAPSHVGVDDLRGALDRMVAVTPPAVDRHRPRLWVDRSFSLAGVGTVVTGTLAGGTIAVGDGVVVEPGGRPARVRGLQTAGRAVDRVGPGHRVALNLAGIDHRAVGRGDAVVGPGRWRPASVVDATVRVLDSVEHDVSRRGAHVAYIGSGEWPVRVRVLGTERLAPGAEGLVRLHLPAALPLLPGDRYVLRDAGRGETVGGGEILDVAPVLPAGRARPDRSVDRVVAERGWVDVDELEAITGARRPATVGRWIASPAAIETLVASLARRVAEAGPLGVDTARLDEREREALAGGAVPGLIVANGRVRPVGADPVAEHPWVAALAAGGMAPPGPEGVDPAQRRELVRRGLVVERDGIWFHPSAVEAAAQVVATLLAAHPEGITVSQAREAFGVTRKHALPLLNELDRRGITRRRGDVRIAGPRSPGG